MKKALVLCLALLLAASLIIPYIRADNWETEEFGPDIGGTTQAPPAPVMPGDINDDGKLTNRDATRLLQYLAGWDVEVVEAAMDINGDGKVTNRDATRLLQYLAGWDVAIH